MQIETLNDVLDWTLNFHQHLSKCLEHCSSTQESERAKLLLQYLASHEKKLSNVIEDFQQTASSSALNTWCYEYLEKYPLDRHTRCSKPFAELSSKEIIKQVEDFHAPVIALYRYLRSRADAPSAHELLDQLTSIEEHEAMQMAHGANRLEDL